MGKEIVCVVMVMVMVVKMLLGYGYGYGCKMLLGLERYSLLNVGMDMGMAAND
jgi:hypothetical protein